MWCVFVFGDYAGMACVACRCVVVSRGGQRWYARPPSPGNHYVLRVQYIFVREIIISMARGFSIYARARARTCALVGVDANIGTFNSGGAYIMHTDTPTVPWKFTRRLAMCSDGCVDITFSVYFGLSIGEHH